MTRNNELRHKPALQRRLLSWFRRNGRDLPWRQTHNSYAVLVSEIMLQQTTVATVVPYYRKWLQRFPTMRSLARATESEVLHAWQGLGYYSRARNLHRCAQISVARFGGSLPSDTAQLRLLPGIGRYTANAVGVFAFDQPLPLVEANTARVLTRLLHIRDCIDSTAGREQLWAASARLVPPKCARDFHSAMMDLGALVCTARAPQCGICPIQKFCAAPDPESLPVKRSRPQVIRLVESHALLRRRNAVLLERCRARWRGMWMLPSIPLGNADPIYTARFPFTHHQITLRVFSAIARRSKRDEHWFAIDELSDIAMPSPHRRALEAILPIRHSERSEAKSKDPEEVTLKVTPRDPSTSLGMTVKMSP